MEELVKYLLSSILGAAFIYGKFKTEIEHIKTELNSKSNHGERLAAIESKIDILINKSK